MTHLIEWTATELMLFEAWKKLVEQGFKEDMDEKVAVLLKISPVTVRTRRSRIKAKYEEMLDSVRRYRSYQQFYYQKTGGKFNPLSRSGRGKK